MPKAPKISGKGLIRILLKLGFVVVRIKGSHHRLKHKDGRITTIPVHGTNIIPTGLLSKIIEHDLDMEFEDILRNL